jgi:hypothetical protein
MDERHFSSAIGCFYLGYVITNLISLHLPSWFYPDVHYVF